MIDTFEVAAQLNTVAKMLAQADGTGPHFTCSETDDIARLLLLAGHRDEALAWLRDHADGDEHGDSHQFECGEDCEDGAECKPVDLSAYITDWLGF